MRSFDCYRPCYLYSEHRTVVKLLQQLFKQLTESTTAAITPDRELELLALESSPRTEEQPPTPLISTRPARQDSMTSDTTVVADPLPPNGGQQLSPSVLGKRRMSNDETIASATVASDAMDVDDDGPRPLEDPSAPTRPPLSTRPPSQYTSTLPDGPISADKRFEKGGLATEDAELVARERKVDGAVEIAAESDQSAKAGEAPKATGAPPPLPPRRSSVKAQTGALLFGKQNDISECLDAMLFKLDIALDPKKLRAAGKGIDGSIVRGCVPFRLRLDSSLFDKGSSSDRSSKLSRRWAPRRLMRRR